MVYAHKLSEMPQHRDNTSRSVNFPVFAQQIAHRATHGATGIVSPSTYHYTRNEYDIQDFDFSHRSHIAIILSENKNRTFFIKRTQHMICNHLLELPPQVLTNRPCCVLIHAPSLYWQRNIISTCHLRCCVSTYISVVIFTPSLNPSM